MEHLPGAVGVTRGDCDIEDEDSVQRFFAKLPDEQFHAVNATGRNINGLAHGYSVQSFRETMRVNVEGSFLLAKHFAQKAPPHSSLTLLSSVVADLGVAGASAYGTSKAALRGLVRSLSKEWAKQHLRINLIEMGYFTAGIIESIPQGQLQAIRMSVPLRRLGNVDELAKAVEYAIGCEYLTGSFVPCSGGLVP